MMTIHFNANLRPIVGKNPGMLHWIMDPEVSGFIIGYDLGGNQVLICNFDVSVYCHHCIGVLLNIFQRQRNIRLKAGTKSMLEG
jgi:hypothetical protein